MNELVITGPQIYTESGIITDAQLIVRQGLIHSIGVRPYSSGANVICFPTHYHLVPGFIDLHVHGAKGCDVMDASMEALQTISETLAVEGTTAFLATTMTAPSKDIKKTLGTVRDYMQQSSPHGAQLLGAHLEGPFLSPQKIGAQCADYLLLPDISLIKQWQACSENRIKLITLAPELSHSIAFIHDLIEHHIIVSMGHTNATYEQAIEAIHAGCQHVTHLFNAMRGIHHREPGIVTAALLSNQVMTELIVDGLHLHPAIVQMIWALKGRQNIILITDAMRAKCLGDGIYELGGQTVTVAQGVARLANQVLAGSLLTMSQAIKNMMQYTHCSLMDTIHMASSNPAKLLKLSHKKGSIAVNKDADLVILDEQLNVVMTIVGGQIVYRKIYD